MILTVTALRPPWARAQAIGERSPFDVEVDQNALDFADEQPGVDVDGFRMLPRAATSIAYDSNVFSSPAPRNERVVSITEAQLHLENEPGAYDLAADAFARTRRFIQQHDQDTTEYGASGSFDLDFNQESELSGHLLAQRRFESRDDIETPDIEQVSFYKEWDGDATYSHTFNRLLLGSTVSARRLDYEDPSQQYRDQSIYRGEVHSAYGFGGGLSLTGSAYYLADDYRYSTPSAVSADTAGALAGVRLSIPDIVDLQFAVGYFRRNFDRQIGDISGLTIRGTATYQLTRLTTVRADLIREDAPTRVVGAFGKIRTDGSLDLRHSYSRTLNLYVRGRVIEDQFDVVNRTDRTFQAQAGATWLFSRRLVFAAEYDYATRNSSLISESFGRHVFSVSIIGRY